MHYRVISKVIAIRLDNDFVTAHDSSFQVIAIKQHLEEMSRIFPSLNPRLTVSIL